MNVGVIGVGVQGQRHARIYSELKHVGNLYVYDVNDDAKNKVSNLYGAIPTESVQECIESSDSVSICVPTEYHYEVAMKANDIGVNFLIEKPITDNFDEAVELAMSTSQNIVSGVGHIERFNPIVSEINKLVYEPVYLEINRHNPASNRIGNTSVIKDLMIHDIDIFRHVLFNDCEFEIYAMGDNDVCAVSFVVNYGGTTLPVFISSSRMSSKKTRRIYMEDINYTVEGDYMSQEIYIHKKPDQYSLSNNKYMQENIVEKVALNKIEPLRVELTKFLDCCLTGEEFPISLKEATTNLEICNKIEELVNAR